GLEVEPHPATCKVVRFGDGPVAYHAAGIANRDHVVLPIRHQILDAGNHEFRRHFRARLEPAALPASRGEKLDVGSADINDEYFHDGCKLGPVGWMFMGCSGAARNGLPERGPGCKAPQSTLAPRPAPPLDRTC